MVRPKTSRPIGRPRLYEKRLRFTETEQAVIKRFLDSAAEVAAAALAGLEPKVPKQLESWHAGTAAHWMRFITILQWLDWFKSTKVREPIPEDERL